MATVAGIRFRKAGKVYYFDPTDVWPNPGDPVIVETVRGVEMGETVTGAREIPDESLTAPLKKIIRMATPEDVKRSEECIAKEKDAVEICMRKIAAHKLDMKLVDAEYTFDGSKLIFYFTANGRVDFRDLVKDLASVFKMRIELRQIGVRDEAKMLGGLGACGRPICCGTFLSDFQPVSIRMAKDQSLSLNPSKISGQCGRLMCCLKYEQDNYEVTLKKLPRVGKEILTPDGLGTVTEIGVIREKVKVRLRQSDDTYDVHEYSLDEVCRPGETLPDRVVKDEEAPEEEMKFFADGMPVPALPETPAPAAPKPRPERKLPPRPERKPAREPKGGKDDTKEETQEPARRRYPRPKGKKQSTEQYFEKNGGDAAAKTEAPAQPNNASGSRAERGQKGEKPAQIPARNVGNDANSEQ